MNTKATSHEKQETSARLGWGGMLALDRSLLDLVLREQYLDALANFGAMDPIHLEAYLDEGERISVSVQGMVLGAPQVGFQNATGFSSDLTLRMNIIAGEYMRILHLPGRPKRVVESFTITEGMGYRVEAPLALECSRPKTSRFASLELNLARAVEFSTNLGPTEYAGVMIGRRLQESISYMRAYQLTYSLGRFVMDDYHPLSPEQFMVRTMLAPWGKSEGSPRYGDGAALVFMKLGIDLRAGGQPTPGNEIPYPIAESATKFAGYPDPCSGYRRARGWWGEGCAQYLQPAQRLRVRYWYTATRHRPCGARTVDKNAERRNGRACFGERGIRAHHCFHC